ncbi:MAG: hypothetical protein LBD70_07870 [Bifidobacteriaceae bacterium]|jgi:hypothetical protein|nr:hypothetical protein [Bifidobacteriaceae bacterium]
MTPAAVLTLIVSLAVVPGGLIVATVFLLVKPERPQYPRLPPDLSD